MSPSSLRLMKMLRFGSHRRASRSSHFRKHLDQLDTDELHKAMQIGKNDTSLFRILKGLTTKESRQVAMIGVNLMNVIGKALLKLNATAD